MAQRGTRVGPSLRIPRRRKRLLAALGIVTGVVVLGMVGALMFTEPRAALLRSLFEAGDSEAVEPGFTTISARVLVTPDVVVPVAGEPDASLDVYQPKQPAAGSLPLVLLVHGGGFISGNKGSISEYATRLASEGYIVASVGYTLAPASVYPTPIRQVNAALRTFIDQSERYGGDPTRVFVGGDSAGAQIASQVAAVQSNPDLAAAMNLTPAVPATALRGALLFCGLYNMATVSATGFPGLETFMPTYLGQEDWADAARIEELSTTSHVTPDYPPTLLVVGDADPFESQAFELEQVLRGNGVDVATQYWTGSGKNLGHEYQYLFTLPEAHSTFAATLTFLAENSEEPG